VRGWRLRSAPRCLPLACLVTRGLDMIFVGLGCGLQWEIVWAGLKTKNTFNFSYPTCNLWVGKNTHVRTRLASGLVQILSAVKKLYSYPFLSGQVCIR
jgi:hypothetical protein